MFCCTACTALPDCGERAKYRNMKQFGSPVIVYICTQHLHKYYSVDEQQYFIPVYAVEIEGERDADKEMYD